MITDGGGDTALRDGDRDPCGIGGAMKPPAVVSGPADSGAAIDSEVWGSIHASLS